MQEKISWYEEILGLDPHSKLFFSLAKLYLENHEPEKAISTLKSGLEHHPDHFEARLLLHHTLQAEERFTEAKSLLDTLIQALNQYPEFWRHWAESLEQTGSADAAVALRFLAQHMEQPQLSWSEVLLQGLRQADGDKARGREPSSGRPQQDRGEARQEPDAGEEGSEQKASSDEGEPYRTKTMADVLAAQGDYDQALEIYSELLEGAESEERREMLQSRIAALQEHREQSQAEKAGGKSKSSPGRGSRRKLVNRLEKLASRLEQKA